MSKERISQEFRLKNTQETRKTDYDAKISDIGGKYFTTSEFNKFIDNVLGAKIKNKELDNKSDISKLINNTDLDEKINNMQQKNLN